MLHICSRASRKTLLASFIVLFLGILTLPAVQPHHFVVAQTGGTGLDALDLSTVRAADISDAQLRSYVNRAEAEGFTIDEAFRLARERGLPASEAAALRQRVEQMQQTSGSGGGTGGTSERATATPPEIADDERPQRNETEISRRTFGSQMFRSEDLTFTPSLNIPTPASYELGPGDGLVVNIWGDATNVYRLEVSPEGTVAIDNLGPIYVNGLTIEEASNRIIENLRTLYSGLRPGNPNQTTFAQVSLDRLRSIQVTIIGEVNNPGNYTVSSMATVFNALYRSGGPNQRGSYRHIRLVRDNAVIAELDLYDFLINGRQTANVRLRDQDVILVPPYENRVEIRGQVKRNAFFELNEGETLQDLIRYAGYFTDRAYTRQIRLHRNTPIERRVINVESEKFATFELQGGDVVFVDDILDRFENRVTVSGAVWRSGEFELREGMTLRQLILEADGLRPDAFMNRGIIHRLREDLTREQVAFDLQRVMNDPQRYDIPLQREDQVVIRSIHDIREEFTVSIGGAVQNGGSFAYRENMTLQNLILLANGFRESASEARIEVSRRVIGEPAPDIRGDQLAETFMFEVSRDLELSEADQQFKLQPFDHVYVHRRPDYQVQQNVRIAGEVLYPGTYTIRDRNERISDLIARAGGLTDEAFIPGARLIRQSRSLDRADIEVDFISDEEDSAAAERAAMARGREMRIGIDLEEILRRPGSQSDLYLRAGDVLEIPEKLQTVRIAGEVMQDVEVRYREGFKLKDYIDMAGGYTENARKRRAYVIYANGDVDRRNNYLFGLIASNPDIEPGAEIIIPGKRERERMSTGEIIALSSTIVSMLATVTIAIDRLSR